MCVPAGTTWPISFTAVKNVAVVTQLVGRNTGQKHYLKRESKQKGYPYYKAEIRKGPQGAQEYVWHAFGADARALGAARAAAKAAIKAGQEPQAYQGE